MTGRSMLPAGVREYVKRGDIIIIAALLIISLVLFALSFASSEDAACAVIMVNGERVAELPLDKDTTYTISADGHINIIEVCDGRVRMAQADCHDGICMAQSWISSGGEVIVCLPNRVTITIEGEYADEAPDAVAY